MNGKILSFDERRQSALRAGSCSLKVSPDFSGVSNADQIEMVVTPYILWMITDSVVSGGTATTGHEQAIPSGRITARAYSAL
jgi:hypothetical protein